MENPASFDLNSLIQHWRENLALSPAFRSENLKELESHLRDSIAALQRGGLSVEEAFLVATKRIGKDALLETEFGKINQRAVWLDRALWALIGMQLLSLVGSFLNLIAQGAVLLGLNGAGYYAKAHGHAIPAALFILADVVGFAGSLGLCWWLIRRQAHSLGRWAGIFLRPRGMLALTFGVLWLLFQSTWMAHAAVLQLMHKIAGLSGLSGIYVSLGYANGIFYAVQPAVLIALTLFLARKRLGPKQTPG